MPPQYGHPRPPNRFGWWHWEQPWAPLHPCCPPCPHPRCMSPPRAPRPSLTPGAGGGCHLPSRPAVPAEADGDGKRRSGRSCVSPCHEPASPQPPGDGSFAWPSPLRVARPSPQWHPRAPRCHCGLCHWQWHPVPRPDGCSWVPGAGVTRAVPKRVTLVPVGGKGEGGAGAWGLSPWVCPRGDTGDAPQGCPQLRGRGHRLPGAEVTELRTQ